MKLDPRIIKGKKPLDCFDIDIARQFIGKEGYFCRGMHLFSDVKKIGSISVLAQIKTKDPAPFIPYDQPEAYEYFLPAEWLKPEEQEKKYRPFSLNEFLKIFDIGDIVEFRAKNCDEFYRVMFIGYITNSNRSMDEKPGEIDVMLGNYLYSLSHLFEDYELFFKDEWQPFGVEDEE